MAKQRAQRRTSTAGRMQPPARGVTDTFSGKAEACGGGKRESITTAVTNPQLLSPAWLPPGHPTCPQRWRQQGEPSGSSRAHAVHEAAVIGFREQVGGCGDATWMCTHNAEGKHPPAPPSKGSGHSRPGDGSIPHTGVQGTGDWGILASGTG